MTTTYVHISDITFSQEVSETDWDIVLTCRQLFRDNGGWDEKKVPPVLVFVYVTNGKESFVLHDGHHRVLAALEERIETVPVLNVAAMRRGEKISYRAAIRRYRKLISHPSHLAATKE